MTSTPISAPATVRLHDHWRDPARVEAADAFTLRRAAKVLTTAGYSVTASPPDTSSAPEGGSFYCDDLDTRNLRRVLIESGLEAVIATVTRPTPVEEAEDGAARQEAEAGMEAGMEAEAEDYVESEAQRPTPEPWAPF